MTNEEIFRQALLEILKVVVSPRLIEQIDAPRNLAEVERIANQAFNDAKHGGQEPTDG